MKSSKLFYAGMRKVMVALIGDALPSPLPKPLAGLSAGTPGHRGSMELVFNEDIAFATPQLDRARWVASYLCYGILGHSRVT